MSGLCAAVSDGGPPRPAPAESPGDPGPSRPPASDGPRIDESTIVLDLAARDWADAIRELGATLVRNGSVAPGWVAAAIERERIQPTGLPTLPVGVAIPHADPDLVLHPAIAIGRTSSPIQFREMASDDGLVDVRLLFMPAFESKAQALLLSRLIGAFQRDGFLADLLAVTAPAEAVRILRAALLPTD